MGYNFEAATKEWIKVPIDQFGYFDTSELLKKSDEELIEITKSFELFRYDLNGDRNRGNKWRHCLGLDITFEKTIVDFGCGFGIESLQFAKNNNNVILADICQSNIDLAERVLNIHGYKPIDKLLIKGLTDYPRNFDIFYANGVLHHTPQFKEILEHASTFLNDGGEVRLMLYSDIGWKIYISSDVPYGIEDITTHPLFPKFLRTFDSVGYYADFYYPDKVTKLTSHLFDLVSFDYITFNDRYCVVKLIKK